MDNEVESSCNVDPSSFQSSRTGFTTGVTNVNHVRTPLGTRGYQTPPLEQDQTSTYGSCGKVFGIKNTYKRHIKSCAFKRKLHKRRKLSFKASHQKEKRDLFAECLSSSSNSDNDRDENPSQEDQDQLQDGCCGMS